MLLLVGMVVFARVGVCGRVCISFTYMGLQQMASLH